MLSFIALFTVPPHLRLPLSRKTREQVAIYSRPQLFRGWQPWRAGDFKTSSGYVLTQGIFIADLFE